MTGMICGAAVLYALFFLMCFFGTGGDAKNIQSFYSYPEAVRERVRRDPKLGRMIPKRKPLAAVFLANAILFAAAFTVLGLILDLRQFVPALVYFLIAGEGLNLFDLIVIDMCWWRNTARTRFSSVPEKALYRDMKEHVGSFVRGIPVFVVSAAAAAALLALL